MSLASYFGWTIQGANDEMPDIFPLSITQSTFVQTDIVNIYSKILTDVVERTHGLTEDQQDLLWDNCVKSHSQDGLLTMLAKAMADKKDLFIVYDKALGVIREATQTEKQVIETDYKTKAESSVGVFISFKNYVRSDMIRLYSALEFCTVGSLNKMMNLSKAIQFKMSDLRASVSLTDSADIKSQALQIATGLGNGKDVLLDAKDHIETAIPDMKSVKESIEFLNQKRAFYLGMPDCYISGEQTGGLGTSGENDTKAIERGLKNYYFSIMKPTLDTIFGAKTSYKSQDFRQIANALEALKTFDLVTEDLITIENKKKIIEGMLDIDEDDNKTTPQPDVQVTPPVEVKPKAAFGNA